MCVPSSHPPTAWPHQLRPRRSSANPFDLSLQTLCARFFPLPFMYYQSCCEPFTLLKIQFVPAFFLKERFLFVPKIPLLFLTICAHVFLQGSESQHPSAIKPVSVCSLTPSGNFRFSNKYIWENQSDVNATKQLSKTAPSHRTYFRRSISLSPSW